MNLQVDVGLDRKSITGPAGDVIQLRRLVNVAGAYRSTVLSEAQRSLHLAKLASELSDDDANNRYGFSMIPAQILRFMQGEATLDNSFQAMNTDGLNPAWECNLDAMTHANKGAVGLRVEHNQAVVLERVVVTAVKNSAQRSNDAVCSSSDDNINGARGITFGFVPTLNATGNTVSHVTSSTGSPIGIETFSGIPQDVVAATNNVSKFRVGAGLPIVNAEPPPPPPP